MSMTGNRCNYQHDVFRAYLDSPDKPLPRLNPIVGNPREIKDVVVKTINVKDADEDSVMIDLDDLVHNNIRNPILSSLLEHYTAFSFNINNKISALALKLCAIEEEIEELDIFGDPKLVWNSNSDEFFKEFEEFSYYYCSTNDRYELCDNVIDDDVVIIMPLTTDIEVSKYNNNLDVLIGIFNNFYKHIVFNYYSLSSIVDANFKFHEGKSLDLNATIDFYKGK